MMKKRSRAALVLVALALLAAACGSSNRASDEAATSTTATSSPSTSGKFGTIDSPCGKGDAKGATDTGVTDNAIQIAYGDDAGYPGQPGLSHQTSDAMKAFIAWCNEQGGINGRKVEGTYHDAKITEVGNVISEACKSAFYLVGEYWVLDDGQEQPRRECGLPAVPQGAGTAKFANGPLMHQPVPGPLDRGIISAGVQLKKLFPDTIKDAGVLWGNYPVIIDRKDNVIESFGSIGYTFKPSCSVSYSIAGESDWKPLVQKLKDCGAKWVYWVGSPTPNLLNVLEAADQLEYKPIWYVDANTYDPLFVKANQNGFGDRVYMRMSAIPFEEAEHSKAVQQYIDIVKGDGGDISATGAQAASAFLLWATAAKTCGSDLTRKCVEKELAGIKKWDGGGLHAPANPGDNEPTQCGFLLGVKATKFVRVTPKEPGTFDCDPSYIFKLTGEVVTRNKIGADRIAPL